MVATKTKTEAENISVARLVPDQPKYIVEIAPSDAAGAVDPVFLSNGDYKCTIKRGVPLVCPEAIVEVLKNAITGVMDPVTRVMREVPSYPYNAVPYSGTEKIGTVIER